MAQAGPTPKIHRIGFLLVSDFSLLAFSSAFDALRMANRMRERKIYEWQVLTHDGQPISSSSQLSITPDGDVASATDLDMLFVCAGDKVHLAVDKSLLFWLRKLAHRKVVMGAICTGSYLLARAGLLDGYRCTIHWENMASMREEFPNTIVSQELFEIDRDRYTCSGGTAHYSPAGTTGLQNSALVDGVTMYPARYK